MKPQYWQMVKERNEILMVEVFPLKVFTFVAEKDT